MQSLNLKQMEKQQTSLDSISAKVYRPMSKMCFVVHHGWRSGYRRVVHVLLLYDVDLLPWKLYVRVVCKKAAKAMLCFITKILRVSQSREGEGGRMGYETLL